MNNIRLRRLVWRVGRALYMRARRDFGNDIATNGERTLQHRIAQIARHRRNQLTVLDIGANVGEWSLSMLTVVDEIGLADWKLSAFEPAPKTRERLIVALHKYAKAGAKIEIVPFAVTNSTGTARFGIISESGGTNSLAEAPSMIEVQTITIAEFCTRHSLEGLIFIKSDVEGFDLDVLIGALPLLRLGNIAIFQFEYNSLWLMRHASLKQVFDLIKETPYYLGKVTSNGIELYKSWHPEIDRYFEANYVLVRADLAKECGAVFGSFDLNNTYAQN